MGNTNAGTVPERQKREKRILLDQLEKTPVIQIACEKTGVWRSTYYRWIREDSEFAKDCAGALDRWTSLMNDLAESQLLKSVRDGNMTGIIFWLKSRHPAYGNRMEISGPRDREELTEEESKLVRKVLSWYGKSDFKTKRK